MARYYPSHLCVRGFIMSEKVNDAMIFGNFIELDKDSNLHYESLTRILNGGCRSDTVFVITNEMEAKAIADVTNAIKENSSLENTIALDSYTPINTTAATTEYSVNISETPITTDFSDILLNSPSVVAVKVHPDYTNSNPNIKHRIVIDPSMKNLKDIREVFKDVADMELEPYVEPEDVDLFSAKKRKNRLSQMGKSSYGPQKLHRKK